LFDKASHGAGIFSTASPGVTTSRDAWVYASSTSALTRNVTTAIDFFNSESARMASTRARANGGPAELDTNPTRFSWSRKARQLANSGSTMRFDARAIRQAIYRPFNRRVMYFDRGLNESTQQIPREFPTDTHSNLGIYTVGMNSAVPFSVLALDRIPDLHVTGAGSSGMFFPRWTYEPIDAQGEVQGKLDLDAGDEIINGFRRVDNIAGAALSDHRAMYGTEVTGDDVFFYVYGLLHSPDYRSAFAADLKKMLPRIPKVPAEHFQTFVDAGRVLADLHVGYESVEPYPLTIAGEPSATVTGDALYAWYRVEKMRHPGSGRTQDPSTVVYNSRITVSGIPAVAHEYVLGSRSALAWVMNRYQVKTDKASGIANDPNDWSREVGDPRYILDLLGRVVRVSVDTVRIVNSLPALTFD
jgi:predicted helicase